MKIYLDMDGVLADFDRHMANIGIDPNVKFHQPKSEWDSQAWKREASIQKEMTREGFWLEIPMMPGARDLWNYAKTLDQGRVSVLTAKPKAASMNAATEKLEWLIMNVGQPDDFVCCLRSEKSQYAKGNILVDDHPENCFKWEAAGGRAILHTSAEGSIKALAGLRG